MAATQLSFHGYLPPFGCAVGLYAIVDGLWGLSNPNSWSGTTGFPMSKSSSGKPITTTTNTLGINSGIEPYISFTAARSLGGGLTILALYATGNRKGLGAYFVTQSLTVLLDGWVCLKYEAEKKFVVGHVVLGTLIGVLGYGLYFND